jgi:hypothetical protein
MQKKIAAFVAFNAYLFCIVSAFFNALPERFRLDFRSSQLLFGPDLGISHWDPRYLLFLLVSVAGTSIAATLAGAIAQSRGGVIAAKSALPLTLAWVEMFFSSLFTGTFGFAAVSLAAVPLTILVSSYCGRLGERVQREQFSDRTVFGVYPYHFVWMIVPLFVSVYITASWLPYFESALFRDWLQGGFSKTATDLLSLVYVLLPALTLWYLLYAVYKILNGKILKIRSEWMKALFAIGLLVAVPIVSYPVLIFIGWLMRLIPLEGI